MAENGGRAVSGAGKSGLKLFTERKIDDGAGAYYRLHVPAIGMNEDGRIIAVVQDYTGGLMGQPEVKEWFGMAARCDFNMYAGAPTHGCITKVKHILQLVPGTSGPFKRMKYPPTVIWSIDDNMHFVDPLNQSYAYHGTRLPDGTLLEPGDNVEIEGPDGKMHVLWTDGAKYGAQLFDIAENLRKVEVADTMLKGVAGLTCTTDRLSDHYRGVGVENVYTYPNSVIFEDYQRWKNDRILRKDPKRLRVLWQGGSSHLGDWFSIKPMLPDLCRQYPELLWQLWGAEFPSAWKGIPDHQFEFLPWVQYQSYKTVLSMMDYDFSVAPLLPNVFNEGKSAIKFYESAAVPDPKPCLAANVPPYSDEMIDGETGLLYSSPAEFTEKFCLLAENPALRKELGENAQQWLKENRDYTVTTPGLVDWMLETRDKTTAGDKSALEDMLNEYLGDD